MGLRQLAETDLGHILEDDSSGFGWPITLTDPDGNINTDELLGFTDDIAQIIDPDTGQAVSGRLASVAIRIARLTEVGLTLPRGIADSGSKPWIVEFDDINGNPYKFKVSQSNPDRAIGLVTLILELYE
jgi:hypothetical protein